MRSAQTFHVSLKLWLLMFFKIFAVHVLFVIHENRAIGSRSMCTNTYKHLYVCQGKDMMRYLTRTCIQTHALVFFFGQPPGVKICPECGGHPGNHRKGCPMEGTWRSHGRVRMLEFCNNVFFVCLCNSDWIPDSILEYISTGFI